MDRRDRRRVTRYAGSLTQVRDAVYGDPVAKPFRTMDARPNAASLVKPGELVDLV